MRIEHSIKNSAAGLISQFLSMALQFVTRIVFIHTLSEQYLGLNGLFISILSLLSLSELGIGTAIVYAMYKPLAEHDERMISALMNLFSKAYRIIGMIVTILGLALLPFWKLIVDEVPNIPNIDVIYLLFLFNTTAGYFFSYKRALIMADQRDAVNVVNQSTFLILQNILQIALLFLTHEYIFYLAVQIVMNIASNIAISRKADRMYPFLAKYRGEKLDKETIGGIKHNVSAMLMHQIGSVVVTGTDNMLIGHAGLELLGFYSNYTLITQTVSTILRQVFNAITASVGNLVALEDQERQYEMYLNIWLVNFWVYGFCAIGMAILMNPFIRIIAPANYQLSEGIVLMIVANFFLFGMRQTNIIYVNTAGLFWQLRFKSIIEAAINLITSLYFLDGLHMGIPGVLLGTIISTLTTNFWWEPYVVYRHCFRKTSGSYFIQYGLYLAVLVGTYIPVKYLSGLVPGTGVANFLAQGIVCAVMINLIFLAVFFKTRQFHYMKHVFAKICEMALGFVRRRISTESRKM